MRRAGAIMAVLMLSLSGGVLRADKIKIAVPDIALSGVKKNLGKILTEILITEAANNNGVKITGSSDIAAMLGFDRQKELLGCTDDVSCVAEIGGALGVDYLLISDLGKLGSMYVLNLKLIDVSKAEVKKRIYKTVTGGPEKLIQVVKSTLPEIMAAAGVAGVPISSLPIKQPEPGSRPPPKQPEPGSRPSPKQPEPGSRPSPKQPAHLTTVPPATMPQATVPQATVGSPPPAVTQDRSSTWPQWTLISSGSALVAASIVGWVMAIKRHSEGTDFFPSQPFGGDWHTAGALQAIRDGQKISRVSSGIGCLGLAAFVTGFIWLRAADDKPAAKTTLHVMPGTDSVGIALSTTW